MKNVKRNTLLAALFLSATLFISCQEKTNAESAEENLVEAQQDLNDVKTEAQEDAQNLATQAEYDIFKAETEVKIQANKVRIAELKVNKNAKDLERINALEAKNSELDERLKSYESYKTDWSKFKEEFNKDMNDLGDSFKNFTE
jgi:predicted  nucleic acid-binding Zn-ribbon protein